jgi:uncharacterized protein (TIGR00725 family)
MGSAGGDLAQETWERVQRFGEEVGRRGYVLVTGAALGLPQQTMLGAKRAGVVVVNVSPTLNLDEHVHECGSPSRGYETVVFTGSGLMGREIENIRTCDVVMFAGGRSGTLDEFAIAYEEGKVIGMLSGIGGMADSIGESLKLVGNKTEAVICYDADPLAC